MNLLTRLSEMSAKMASSALLESTQRKTRIFCLTQVRTEKSAMPDPAVASARNARSEQPLVPGMQGQSSHWCQECKVRAATGAKNARSEQPLVPGMQGQSSHWCQECKVRAATGARNARSEQPLVPGMQGQSSH